MPMSLPRMRRSALAVERGEVARLAVLAAEAHRCRRRSRPTLRGSRPHDREAGHRLARARTRRPAPRSRRARSTRSRSSHGGDLAAADAEDRAEARDVEDRVGAAAMAFSRSRPAARRIASTLRRLLVVERALRPGHDVGGDDAEAAHRGLEGADAGRRRRWCAAGATQTISKSRQSRSCSRARRGPVAAPGQRPRAGRSRADRHWRGRARRHARPSAGRCRRRSPSRSSGRSPGVSARSSSA